MDLFFFERRHRKFFAVLVAFAVLLWTVILAVYLFEYEIAEAYIHHRSKNIVADEERIEISHLPGDIVSRLSDLGIQCSGAMCYAIPLPQDGDKELSNFYIYCDEVWIIAIPAQCIVSGEFKHSHDRGLSCRMPMKRDQCCFVWTPEWFFYVQRQVPDGHDAIVHGANRSEVEGLRVECYGNVEFPDVLWACW